MERFLSCETQNLCYVNRHHESPREGLACRPFEHETTVQKILKIQKSTRKKIKISLVIPLLRNYSYKTFWCLSLKGFYIHVYAFPFNLYHSVHALSSHLLYNYLSICSTAFYSTAFLLHGMSLYACTRTCRTNLIFLHIGIISNLSLLHIME